MARTIPLVVAVLALAMPAAAQQSTSERDRAARERTAERTREREERAREKEDERRERERAGVLDTVVAFDPRGTVTVTCQGGTVTVIGSDKNEIRIRARTESGPIRFNSNSSRATLEPASGRGCSDGRFEVTVPVGARVTATTWSGSVSVRGVHGAVEAHSQSGDVEVRDAGDRLDVETLSGDVEVSSVKGEATIRTVSGTLQLNGARGNLQVETISGDVELRDVTSRQIRAHTTNGDIDFQGAILEGGRYEFGTHSGEIGLQVLGDIGAELSVSTFSGSIESDFPITLKPGEHGIGASQAKRLNFTVGRGSARIIAETFSGDITLRRRR